MLLGLDMQICEAFSANRYPFPEEPSRQRQMNAEVTARLRELQTTIEAGAAPACQPKSWCYTLMCIAWDFLLYLLQACMAA